MTGTLSAARRGALAGSPPAGGTPRAPEATRGPAAQAVGPRGPVPTGRWQVTPREPWPRAPELRLDTQPRPECQRAAGAGWQRGAAGRKFRPGLVGAHQTDSPQVASLTDLLEATYGHMVNASPRPRRRTKVFLGQQQSSRLALPQHANVHIALNRQTFQGSCPDQTQYEGRDSR